MPAPCGAAPQAIMMIAKRTWLLLLLLLVGIATVHAQDPAGELELEKGHVKIRRLSQDRVFREIGKRIPVYEGDVLHSGGNTRAKIYFRKGEDVVSLFSNTLFRVETVSRENTFFGLNIGKALFKVLSRFRNDKFNVKTPTATIGVKGTEFVTGSDGQKTFLLTVTGTVGMASVDFPDRVVLVTQNQASHVEPRRPPSAPVSVPPAAQEQILSQEGVEQFEEVPFEAPPNEEPPDQQGDQASDEESSSEEGDAVVNSDAEEPDIPEDELADVLDQVDQVAEVQDSIEESTDAVSVVNEPGLPEATSGTIRLDFDF